MSRVYVSGLRVSGVSFSVPEHVLTTYARITQRLYGDWVQSLLVGMINQS